MADKLMKNYGPIRNKKKKPALREKSVGQWCRTDEHFVLPTFNFKNALVGL